MKGGKARPSRSIKRIFELFEVQKSVMQRGKKYFFDTLKAMAENFCHRLFDLRSFILTKDLRFQEQLETSFFRYPQSQ